MRAGVILAGGRSTRFEPGDKAVAELAGTPMIRRVADRLGDAVGELVVSCRADQRDAVAAALEGVDPAPSFALDDRPDQGPVAGVATGLAAVDATYAAVVACDMPLVDPGFVDYLFVRASGRDAAVPRPDGHLHPTQAVYRTGTTAAACRRALAGDRRRLVGVLSDLEYVVVDGATVAARARTDTLTNLNTREEFEAVADRL
jgi:molybdopterin-guanine dinucleotide biosynthesis protein A